MLLEQGMLPRTVNNRLSALLSVFKELANKQIVSENPVSGIKRPKINQRVVEAPDTWFEAFAIKGGTRNSDAINLDLVNCLQEFLEFEGLAASDDTHMFSGLSQSGEIRKPLTRRDQHLLQFAPIRTVARPKK